MRSKESLIVEKGTSISNGIPKRTFVHRCNFLDSRSHLEAHSRRWHPHLCFFDLEKAFDSVEYPTLLSHIFKLGVNVKCWHLIKDWYTDTSSVVKVNNKCSDSFPVNRGVKQGSVLSPTLFIAVMDSLLSFLGSSGQGLTLLGLNVGSSAHADDVRAASISVTAAQTQGNFINAFCEANSLKLDANKTELIMLTKGKYSEQTCALVGQKIQSQTDAKCLGVWWRYDLSQQSQLMNVYTKPGVLSSHWGLLELFMDSYTPSLVVVYLKLLSCQPCYMDVRRGFSLNLISISLNHFKLRLENVFWEFPSITPTLVLALDCTGPPLKQGFLFES